jgi:hypothetical protein
VIDFGLLVSMIVAVGVPGFVVRWWPLKTYQSGIGVIDIALGPAFVGLAVGRLVAVLLSDPTSLGRFTDLLIIRSGVEFWPGVAAAALAVAWLGHRDEMAPLARLADVAPLALVGYASYEAACPFRDGCFGPTSAIGLRPPGLTTTKIPIGILMGVVVVVGAVLLHRLADGGEAASFGELTPGIVALGAVFTVASVRAIGSIWLPHVGRGLTRQHQTSIVIAVLTALALVWLVRLNGRRTRTDLAIV